MLSPDLVFQTLTAFQHSAALRAGIELNLFTAIAEGSKTAADLAAACESSERGVRILCDSLTVMGFLTKSDKEYGLNEVSSVFLNRHSPAFLGDMHLFLMSEVQLRGFGGLTQAVRQGGTVITEDGSVAPESDMWVKFARSMAPMMGPPAQMMAARLDLAPERKFKVLDIAAGHGIYGISIAQSFPGAEIYAVDWANVLTVATDNAQKAGVADRHHLIPGDAMEVEFGEGYDLVLLTNFLHHFDADTCVTLLKKINQSLTADGQVMTLEFVPNDDRVSPPAEAMFSLVMLAATPSGDAYTFAELKTMAELAGFSRNEHIPFTPLPMHLIISRK